MTKKTAAGARATAIRERLGGAPGPVIVTSTKPDLCRVIEQLQAAAGVAGGPDPATAQPAGTPGGNRVVGPVVEPGVELVDEVGELLARGPAGGRARAGGRVGAPRGPRVRGGGESNDTGGGS